MQATNKDLEGQLQEAKRAQEASQKLEGTLKEVHMQLAEAKKAGEAQERHLKESEAAAKVIITLLIPLLGVVFKITPATSYESIPSVSNFPAQSWHASIWAKKMSRSVNQFCRPEDCKG